MLFSNKTRNLVRQLKRGDVAKLNKNRNICVFNKTPSEVLERRRRWTNFQIQIQAPPNSPRDEILPHGKSSLLN